MMTTVRSINTMIYHCNEYAVVHTRCMKGVIQHSSTLEWLWWSHTHLCLNSLCTFSNDPFFPHSVKVNWMEIKAFKAAFSHDLCCLKTWNIFCWIGMRVEDTVPFFNALCTVCLISRELTRVWIASMTLVSHRVKFECTPPSIMGSSDHLDTYPEVSLLNKTEWCLSLIHHCFVLNLFLLMGF